MGSSAPWTPIPWGSVPLRAWPKRPRRLLQLRWSLSEATDFLEFVEPWVPQDDCRWVLLPVRRCWTREGGDHSRADLLGAWLTGVATSAKMATDGRIGFGMLGVLGNAVVVVRLALMYTCILVSSTFFSLSLVCLPVVVDSSFNVGACAVQTVMVIMDITVVNTHKIGFKEKRLGAELGAMPPAPLPTRILTGNTGKPSGLLRYPNLRLFPWTSASMCETFKNAVLMVCSIAGDTRYLSSQVCDASRSAGKALEPNTI